MTRDVFISYSRRNMERVMEIKRQIDAECSTDCWIDLRGIESGSEMFLRDIVGGIDACKVFLFMLSQESMESEYALLELNYAKESHKRVVLVNIDDCKMRGVYFFKYSFADTITWNNQPLREKLLRDVKRWIGGSDMMQLEEENNAQSKEEVLLPVCHGGKYGYINLRGETVIPYQWEKAGPFSDGLAKVWIKGWGYINSSGTIVIPPRWKEAESFSEGMAVVKDNITGNYGYIDRTGRLVIPCKWELSRPFSEGLASVQESYGKNGYIGV